MERKLQRIILDLEDFIEEPYLDSVSKGSIEDIIRQLKRLTIYSTET